jgi:hypothetical protein
LAYTITTLQRENSALRERLAEASHNAGPAFVMHQEYAELQKQVAALRGAMQLDAPYHLPSVLEHLIAAVDHLFITHDCDHHGYEVWMEAKSNAVTIHAKLVDALSAPAPAVAPVEVAEKLVAALRLVERIDSNTESENHEDSLPSVGDVCQMALAEYGAARKNQTEQQP